MKRPLPPVVAVMGPTRTFKTALAVSLALRLDGELVSADSQQVWRRMAVGTAQPTAAELRGVACHLVGHVAPEESYSAGRWLGEAEAAVVDVRSRGHAAIVVGGTGLYLRSLLDGWEYPPAPEVALRESISRRIQEEGADALWRELEQLDRGRAVQVDPRNPRRLARALEIAAMGLKAADWGPRRLNRYGALRVGLDAPQAVLGRRIAARVHSQLAAGWMEEVEALLASGLPVPAQAWRAHGYRSVAAALRGDVSEEELPGLVASEVRRYARRQRTWFRRDELIRWYATPSADEAVEGWRESLADEIHQDARAGQ